MKSLVIMTVMTCSLPVVGQDNAPFSHLNVALRASTVGGGLEFATPLGKLFDARAGFDYLTGNVPYSNFSLNDDNGNMYDAFGYVPDLRMKEKLNMVHGHLLADFHPVAKGIFHITAGVFIGTSNLNADGFLANSNNDPAELKGGYEWPKVIVDGREIDFDGGKSTADIYLGNAVKPYLGLGLGNAVTRGRVGFKFELGLLYQGDYSLKQGGQDIDTINEKGINDMKDADRYTKLLRWWPMLNLQLTYRIF
jgi:hypothetical protein